MSTSYVTPKSLECGPQNRSTHLHLLWSSLEAFLREPCPQCYLDSFQNELPLKRRTTKDLVIAQSRIRNRDPNIKCTTRNPIPHSMLRTAHFAPYTSYSHVIVSYSSPVVWLGTLALILQERRKSKGSRESTFLEPKLG